MNSFNGNTTERSKMNQETKRSGIRLALLTAVASITVAWTASPAPAAELPYSGTDLTLWLKADGTLNLDPGPANINRVLGWSDEIGFGGNAVAQDGVGPSGVRPLWVDNVINGLPVVRFNASTRRIDGPAVLPAGSGARTIVIVGSSTDTANKLLFDPNGQGTGSAGDRLFRVTPEVRTRYSDGNTTPGADTVSPDFSVPTTPVIFGVRVPVVGGGATQADVEFFNNSSTVIGGTGSSPGNLLDTGTTGYRFGGSTDWRGDVAEVLVFNSYLSSAELDSIGFYLQQKYALGSSFAAPTDVFFDDLGTGSDWSTGGNWDTATEPSATQNAFIGAGKTANVTQSGEVAKDVFVGHNQATLPGAGTLNINGGSLSTGDLNLGNGNTIGNAKQTAGTVTLSGDLNFGLTGNQGGTYNLDGGALNVAGDIKERIPGVNSAQLHINGGTLAMPNGATTSSILVQRFSVGEATGANATYTANAPITTTGTLAVGGFNNAIGNMTIDDSTFAVNAANASLGQGNTADGTLTVEGTGIFNVTAGDFHIGGDDTGGADSGTRGDFIMGSGADNPTVSVSGGNTEVGTGGTGSFTLNSGTFTQLTSNLVVAQDGAATGTVTVDGGTLNITNGSGSDQDLNFNSGLAIFNHNGGNVVVERDVQMAAANHVNSDATYTMDAGTGSLSIGRHLLVGRDRVGEFNYESGTFSIGGTIYVGGNTSGTATASANSNGTITIDPLGTDPTGGTLTFTTGQFEVGRHNVGIVNQDGGTVNVSSGNLVLGQLANSNGTYNMNAGVLNVTNGLNMNAGTAMFKQTGGTVKIGGNINFASGSNPSTYNLLGGVLDLEGGIIDKRTGPASFLFNGGRLEDVGVFDMDLDQDGGTLAPGGSAGTMQINGNYDLAALGTLEIEIDGSGPGQFDVLDVLGTVTLAGKLEVIGGYDPTLLDSYTIIQNNSTDLISGTFFGLDEGDIFSTPNFGSALRITYQGGTGNDVVLTAVPEPMTMLAVGLGITGLGGYIRRRRRG